MGTSPHPAAAGRRSRRNLRLTQDRLLDSSTHLFSLAVARPPPQMANRIPDYDLGTDDEDEDAAFRWDGTVDPAGALLVYAHRPTVAVRGPRPWEAR